MLPSTRCEGLTGTSHCASQGARKCSKVLIHRICNSWPAAWEASRRLIYHISVPVSEPFPFGAEFTIIPPVMRFQAKLASSVELHPTLNFVVTPIRLPINRSLESEVNQKEDSFAYRQRKKQTNCKLSLSLSPYNAVLMSKISLLSPCKWRLIEYLRAQLFNSCFSIALHAYIFQSACLFNLHFPLYPIDQVV